MPEDIALGDTAGVACVNGRAERGKLMLWLGYPVRLRQHRAAGFFVEPVLMWPVVVPEAAAGAPSIDEHMPMINAKFLRSMTIGDQMQLAEEAVRLSDELGLGVPAAELPGVDDVVERLARIRLGLSRSSGFPTGRWGAVAAGHHPTIRSVLARLSGRTWCHVTST